MFCRSPPTTSNINENNTRHNATIVAAEESSGLPLWAILPFVVLAFLAVVCFVILLIATRIRGFASVRFFRKTAHELENGLSEGRSTTRLKAGGKKREPSGSRASKQSSQKIHLGFSTHNPPSDRTSATQSIIANLKVNTSESLKTRAEGWEKEKNSKGVAQCFGFPHGWEQLQMTRPYQQFDQSNIYVYCDCSDYRQNTGIGAFYGIGHPLNFGLNIGTTRHPFFGELFAINAALHCLSQWGGYKNEEVTLRTDCLNVIIALRNVKKNENEPLIDDEKTLNDFNEEEKKRVVDNLFELLQSFRKITIQWLPSHTGDMGNDYADALAYFGRVGTTTQWKSVYDGEKYKLAAKWNQPQHEITFGHGKTDSKKPKLNYPYEGKIHKFLGRLQIEEIKQINE